MIMENIMKNVRQLPYTKCIESSPYLFLEGYRYIQNQCNQFNTDMFQTYLFGQKVICMRGQEAAEKFYDGNYFERKNVAPRMIQKTLFGEQGVQGLDGEEHKNRKLMFLSIMTDQNIELLRKITIKQWKSYTEKWKRNGEQIVLFDELQEMLTIIACQWAGIPLNQSEIPVRANDFGKMVDAIGSIGLRNWQGRYSRLRTEKWGREIIKKIRAHQLNPSNGSAAYAIAWHSDLNGDLLNVQIAAVELINIIRPIVAIATYITFGALSMYQYPECKKLLQAGGEYPNMFVQEVRRYYPFAPFVGAKITKSFKWKNYYFPKGTLVLFDIYGTNHDEKQYESPNDFNPERFKQRKVNQYDFVPQGGGDCYKGHRCAGEMVTITIMKESFLYMAKHLNYSVPIQDLGYSLRRIPTLPKSRFIIKL